MKKRVYYFDVSHQCVGSQDLEADTMEEIERLAYVYAETIPEEFEVAGFNYGDIPEERD